MERVSKLSLWSRRFSSWLRVLWPDAPLLPISRPPAAVVCASSPLCGMRARKALIKCGYGKGSSCAMQPAPQALDRFQLDDRDIDGFAAAADAVLYVTRDSRLIGAGGMRAAARPIRAFCSVQAVTQVDL